MVENVYNNVQMDILDMEMELQLHLIVSNAIYLVNNVMIQLLKAVLNVMLLHFYLQLANV
jgi:hypothetical protein